MYSLFALLDCNNFYVSCERSFNYHLAGKPVVVLSNNDGCIVARSNEAKALGIKMGTPLFKVAQHIKEHNIQVYSSNYALYGDMSRRVMEIVAGFAPEFEIYSIDEAFLDLSSLPHAGLADYCHTISKTVRRWTGIPVSIGIGKTKTLAKIATRFAKKSTLLDSVLYLESPDLQEQALQKTMVDDIWGIGRRSSQLLSRYHIHTAAQLRDCSDSFIRMHLGLNGLKVVHELRGIPCHTLDRQPPPRKAVTVSRSFATAIDDIRDLKQAVISYVSRGAEKLRQKKTAATAITIFLQTNRFKEKHPYYGSETIQLPVPTSCTPELIHYAGQALRKIYRPGLGYKKAGVVFKGLVPENRLQAALFDQRNRKKDRLLMQALDTVNNRFGSNTIRYAATGNSGRKWQTVFPRRSRSYTTRWDQLPEVC
jgi:DNA polymerase V